MPTLCRLGLLGLLLSAFVFAQGPAFQRLRNMIPPDAVGPFVSGDLDGDGDQDLFDPDVGVLLNDGRGLFSPGPAAPALTGGTFGGPSVADSALADFDGDGDLDAMVVLLYFGIDSFASAPGYWTNDGTGTFTAATLSFTSPPGAPLFGSWASPEMEAADLDGDGDQDVVVSGSVNPGNIRVWINDGSGNFTETLLAQMSGAGRIRLADMDADNDIDIVFTTAGAAFGPPTPALTGILQNDGSGGFTTAPIVLENYSAGRIELGDPNGNGLPDVFTWGGPAMPPALENRFHRNNGGGSFTASNQFAPGPLLRHFAFLDVDGDNQDDLLGIDDNGDLSVRGLAPSGNFGAPFLSLPADSTAFLDGDILLVDVDGDGDLDPLFAERLLFLNDLQGQLLRTERTVLGAAESHGTLVDLLGNGNADLVVSGGGGIRFHVGDGSGRFSGAFVLEAPQVFVNSTDEVRPFDQDGDGDADLLLWQEPRQFPNVWARYLQNLGGGMFAPTANLVGALDTRSTAVGDLDGDGDEDVVVGRFSVTGFSPATVAPLAPLGLDVVFSTGAGSFAAPVALPGPVDFARDLALFDAEGDGDLDLLVANEGTGPSAVPVQLFQNDGAGGFTLLFTFAGLFGRELEVADLDDDGDTDFVLLTTAGAVQTWLNDGTGGFTQSAFTWPPALAAPDRLALVHLDDDGVLDLSAREVLRQVGLLGDGAGGFTLDPRFELPYADAADRTLFGDVDGDRDADLIAIAGSRLILHTNTDRQLWRTAVPALGKPLGFAIQGRPNNALVLAASPQRTGLDAGAAGTLFLDPASLAPFLIGSFDATGAAALTLPIPALPALSGATVYWQAWDGTDLRLSNLEITTLTDG